MVLVPWAPSSKSGIISPNQSETSRAGLHQTKESHPEAWIQPADQMVVSGRESAESVVHWLCRGCFSRQETQFKFMFFKSLAWTSGLLHAVLFVAQMAKNLPVLFVCMFVGPNQVITLPSFTIDYWRMVWRWHYGAVEHSGSIATASASAWTVSAESWNSRDQHRDKISDDQIITGTEVSKEKQSETMR